MSDDALMRWEWEGGTPTSASERESYWLERELLPKSREVATVEVVDQDVVSDADAGASSV